MSGLRPHFCSFLIVVFLLIVSTFSASAQQKSTYKVKAGETLYSISKKLDVTITELKEWNNLQSNTISIAQELVYFSQDEIAEIPEPDTEPAEPLINNASQPDNTFYNVKSGDNLYSISRAHNMTVEELKELNNLDSDNIRVGQRLAVRKLSVAPSVSEFAKESSPQGVFTLYKLQQGESLSHILDKFNMSEQELAELNPDANLQTLTGGRQVTVLLPPSRKYENPYLQKTNLQDLGRVAVSQYASSEEGTSTTNGQLYDPKALTAAHSNIALGSVIFIENAANRKGIYVRVNDRITGAGLKLSAQAFQVLGLEKNAQPQVTVYLDN